MMLSQDKFEIGTKLEREETAVEIYKERMERSTHITNGMVAILNSFESRLARLEHSIVPVYVETEMLQTRQQNIEKTLSALDTVINYYRVSEEVDHVIRSGPQQGSDQLLLLEPFLQALRKLETAQQYFERNSKDSMELENVTTLFNTGSDALAREFKALLHKHSLPIKPVILLDIANADDETFTDEVKVIQQFPAGVRKLLVNLAEWLMDHGRDEYMNVYAAVRSGVLLSSIRQLRDHQKSASGGSTHNIPLLSSPVVKQKFPGHKASKRLQHVFERKANKMLLRASQTLEQSTGLTLGNRRLTALEAREDVVEETEMVNYLEVVVALQKLLESERLLMAGIIPLKHQYKIFEIIIRDAMDLVVQDGENIAARAKKCIARQDFGAVLVVFPILKHLSAMKPEFDKTVDGCDHSVRTKFASIVHTLHSTGDKALEELIESVKNETGSLLPRDGTVHQLTSNVLVFLEQVTEFTEPVGAVLAKSNNTADPRHLLGNYIKRVLVELNRTLISMSETYTDQYLKAVFLLNNYHHILKSLQRSGLLELVRLDEPNTEVNYHKQIQSFRNQYIQCWSKVLSHIYSSEDAGSLQPAKMKDKDRGIIKEKFAGFNKELEELTRTQRSYSVPDLELRESLKRDNKELILPKYHAFYEKWSTVNFSKNMDKYVKYKPDGVSALIDRLFDLAL